MKIATWNVNSIKARLPNALEWLREAKPDVVLLQELKCVNEAFPAMEIEELGYNIALNGQKTYNGVAILSKYPLEDIITTLPGEPEDTQARYIEAVVSVGKEAVRVVSVYVPNGQDPTSDKFPYKLRFMDRLVSHMETLLSYDEKLVIGGDYNVGHQDIDVFDADKIRGIVCFHPEEQKRFRTMLNLGLTDVWRSLNPSEKRFSWWDYRGGGYSKNEGLRIDYLLLSPQAVDTVRASGMDEDTRTREKASDHIPVWCELG
jgi:exodeoxyribonuclease III